MDPAHDKALVNCTVSNVAAGTGTQTPGAPVPTAVPGFAFASFEVYKGVTLISVSLRAWVEAAQTSDTTWNHAQTMTVRAVIYRDSQVTSNFPQGAGAPVAIAQSTISYLGNFTNTYPYPKFEVPIIDDLQRMTPTPVTLSEPGTYIIAFFRSSATNTYVATLATANAVPTSSEYAGIKSGILLGIPVVLRLSACSKHTSVFPSALLENHHLTGLQEMSYKEC